MCSQKPYYWPAASRVMSCSLVLLMMYALSCVRRSHDHPLATLIPDSCSIVTGFRGRFLRATARK
eukprot:6189055-Amphidinium_carterae.2